MAKHGHIGILFSIIMTVSFLFPHPVFAHPDLIDMDIYLMQDTNTWEMFPMAMRAEYIICKYAKDIQDWYRIADEDQVKIENFIIYSRATSKKYNSVLSFCLYPDDDYVYINRNKFGAADDNMPGSLHAIGVLAHELCHIKQMKEGRGSDDPKMTEAMEAECNTNAANYLYYLTGNEYVFNNYMPVSFKHVHTY